MAQGTLNRILQRGFTLIELVIIIVIMLILAAIFVSPRSYLSEIRPTQAAHKIEADIRYAQSYALARQKRTRISFDASLEGYSVYVEETAGSWTLMKDPLTKKDFTIDFAQGDYKGVDIVQTNFDGTNYGLVFNAAGTPNSYNPIGAIAELANEGSVTLTGGVSVRVEPKTGKAKIQ